MYAGKAGANRRTGNDASARVFHVKRFYVPLGVAAAVAVVFAITFALGQACPQGYTLTGGRCVQNAAALPSTGANQVLAGPPTGSTAAPATARALVAADIPPLPGVNFANDTGANNALVATIPGLTVTNGTCVLLYLQHTLQVGANTFALNGGAALPILTHFGGGANIAKGYAAGYLINLCNAQAAFWLDMSQ
jgi:hypothetical protein